MIAGDEKLAEIFSVFHDGFVSAHRVKDGDQELEVEIPYLAKRIRADYTKFILTLHNARDFSFAVWTNDSKAQPSLMKDPEEIFRDGPGINSGDVKNGCLEVFLETGARDFNGMLTFKADSASVVDQGGKEYSSEELVKLCKGYWDDWKEAGRSLRWRKILKKLIFWA